MSQDALHYILLLFFANYRSRPKTSIDLRWIPLSQIRDINYRVKEICGRQIHHTGNFTKIIDDNEGAKELLIEFYIYR